MRERERERERERKKERKRERERERKQQNKPKTMCIKPKTKKGSLTHYGMLLVTASTRFREIELGLSLLEPVVGIHQQRQ